MRPGPVAQAAPSAVPVAGGESPAPWADAARRGAPPPAHVAGEHASVVFGADGDAFPHAPRGVVRVESEREALEKVLGPRARILSERPAEVRRCVRRPTRGGVEAAARTRAIAARAARLHVIAEGAEGGEVAFERAYPAAR